MKYKAKIPVELSWGDEDTQYLAGVTHYHDQKPDRYCKDSDVDYYGYIELEWELLNMDGTLAHKVESVLNERQKDYIEEKIKEEMDGYDEDR